ncbi:MAG: DUF2384 domain-containing protein [Bryobacterales bacterium]|nr:DUF2384 domain-containing protein [Bryobacterales bacterium]
MRHVEIMAIRNFGRGARVARPWKPLTGTIVLRPAARLLGADSAQVSRWTARTEPVGAEMGRRIVDLHDVLTRILRIFNRDTAALWLVGSEPLLGGARPIDVLAMEGAARLIRAIDGIAEGAFA